MNNVDLIKKCIINKDWRDLGFRKALIQLRFEEITFENALFLSDNYFNIKGDADRTADRSLLLHALVLQCLQYDMRDFFAQVYKKERLFNMKVVAIRGLSHYLIESEIVPLVDHLIKLLNNPSKSNILYIECEMIKSEFGLPYLINKYGYQCFKNAMNAVDLLYEKMPDELKGFFTLDSYGIQIQLLSADERNKRFKTFLSCAEEMKL